MFRQFKPKINGESFAKDYMMRRARRKAEEYAVKLGEDNWRWLIENNRSLYDYLKPLIADHEERLRQRAKQYSWMNDAFSDQDILSLLPPWLHKIIAETPNGNSWIKEQIKTIRQFFV